MPSKKVNQSTRRLLDLLAGWTNFASDDKNKKIKKEGALIALLYGEAAYLETDEEVKKFVKKKIIPFLLDGE